MSQEAKRIEEARRLFVAALGTSDEESARANLVEKIEQAKKLIANSRELIRSTREILK